MRQLTQILEEQIGTDIQRWVSISGGDISSAYQLVTSGQDYFLKINDATFATDMFRQERYGLDLIRSTQTISTPKVVATGRVQRQAYLLLEWVAPKSPGTRDMATFGRQLALLHQVTKDKFGAVPDNYIGRLPQSNQSYLHWKDFYWLERLQPQFRLAQDVGLLSSEQLPTGGQYARFADIYLTDIQPSLLHGDLWRGNFLIGKQETPYLVDPAIYYGHAEVDLAMSRLFGDFGANFYDAYAAEKPPQAGWEKRQDLYQLYYLLVHLNLFGTSYRSSVLEKLGRCFG